MARRVTLVVIFSFLSQNCGRWQGQWYFVILWIQVEWGTLRDGGNSQTLPTVIVIFALIGSGDAKIYAYTCTYPLTSTDILLCALRTLVLTGGRYTKILFLHVHPLPLGGMVGRIVVGWCVIYDSECHSCPCTHVCPYTLVPTCILAPLHLLMSLCLLALLCLLVPTCNRVPFHILAPACNLAPTHALVPTHPFVSTCAWLHPCAFAPTCTLVPTCTLYALIPTCIASNDYPFSGPIIYTGINSQCYFVRRQLNNAWHNNTHSLIGMPCF